MRVVVVNMMENKSICSVLLVHFLFFYCDVFIIKSGVLAQWGELDGK